MTGSPFHAGEQRVQEKLGVRESIEPWARKVVRDHLTAQHREFYPQLPFVVAAARDAQGRPWATLLTGLPGFVTVPDEHGLAFDTKPLPGDALECAFVAGAELGLLGIEPDTRRRNRVNGTITEVGANGIRFEVGQTFGNCPQYITERTWFEADVDDRRAGARRVSRLDAGMREWIATADTFFIASGYDGAGSAGGRETFGMDTSHRGGAPGFVEVRSDTCLVFPDYAGNNHFNTIGNLVMDPRVGLLFVDFEAGGLLQVTGTATIDFDSDEVGKYPRAQRLVIVDIEEVVHLDGVLPIRWTAPQGSVRELRVIDRAEETADVVSLTFEARDGTELPDFEAGQHLPIELYIEGEPNPVKRTYSLSNAPGTGRYRISVKREAHGLVSNLLHDSVDVGAIVSAREPAGEFRLAYSTRPVVLISAGIGVTPMVSMLHRLVADGGDRQVTFIHGSRDGDHHAFAAEVRRVASEHSSVTLAVAYSRPKPADVAGRDYHHSGRIDRELIEALVTNVDADIYLCGPMSFMAAATDALEGIGVAAADVHTETFGPVV